MKNSVRVIAKFLCFIFILIAYTLAILIAHLLFFHDRLRRRAISSVVSFFGRMLLACQNVRYTIHDPENIRRRRTGCLFAANHLSYLDIPLLAAAFKGIFITSFDLNDFAIPGYMARLGGSVFVDRSRFSRIKEDIRRISRLLLQRHNIFLFPEAKAGDGTGIAPFRPSLFVTAIESAADIVPVCLRYISVDGELLSRDNRDRIFWYGGMPFFPHLLQLMKLAQIRAEIRILPALATNSATDRRAVAQQARQAVEKAYQDLLIK